jgi:hypothetical protein
MELPDELIANGPVVIGATGGSGTRVVARVARRAGMFIGADLNDAEDARPLGAFVRRCIDAYLSDHATPAWSATEAAMRRSLEEAVRVHCGPLATAPGPWGWKVPRSIFLLPFLDAQFPSMRFVHVVRDGRDMAFSDNQAQLMSYGSGILGAEESGWDMPQRSMALWNRVNLAAADFGERTMGPRYLRLRLEDLCLEPVQGVARLLAFLQLDADAASIARLEVQRPSSLGRWRTYDPALLADLQRIGAAGLGRFGYQLQVEASAARD